ncbi:hypothetical protein ACIOYV_01720 [Pseudomonas sp. NPDC087342]|uniref:hypothetical protein n=1 Tax=Pseudomonas sp. NPDC087342 TaxID=3364437 RepID=UPI00382472CB
MSDDNVYQQVQLQVSNLQAGQRVVVQVSPEGSPIAWSAGPAFNSASGINLEVDGGGVPIYALSVSPSQLSVDTTFGQGGSGAMSFSVALYLVAQPGIQVFRLRSMSDPGILIVAGIGDSQPQTVNQTLTLFSWNPQ